MFVADSSLTPLPAGLQVPLEVNAVQALGMEVLCTFQLVFTVYAVEDQRRRESSADPTGNLAIGFAHTTGVLMAVRGGALIQPSFSLDTQHCFPKQWCMATREWNPFLGR